MEPKKTLRAMRISTTDGTTFELDTPNSEDKVCRWRRLSPGRNSTLKLRTSFGILLKMPSIKIGEPLVLKARPLTQGLPVDTAVAYREIRTAPVERIQPLFTDEESDGSYCC